MTSPSNDDWVQQAFRQAPWRTQTQTTSLVLAAVVLVAVIGALYLAQASRTAAAGRRLQELEARRQVLEQQNAQLRAEIAALRSVPRLSAEAAARGFHPATAGEVEYLVVPNVPPAPLPTPIPPVTAEQIVPRYNETLESWLSERLGTLGAQITEFIRRTFGREPAQEPETPVGEPTITPDTQPEATP